MIRTASYPAFTNVAYSRPPDNEFVEIGRAALQELAGSKRYKYDYEKLFKDYAGRDNRMSTYELERAIRDGDHFGDRRRQRRSLMETSIAAEAIMNRYGNGIHLNYQQFMKAMGNETSRGARET